MPFTKHFPVARRGQIMGRTMTGLRIGPEIFEAIENNIRQAERMKMNLPIALDQMVRMMAYMNLGFAQRSAAGPVDPRQQRPDLAWRRPVRRISGRYYFGWKVRRVGLGTWQLFNDSREAYYIEFGIHVSNRRVRRPIQKLSLMQTVKALQTTAIYHRVWASLMMPPPGQRVGKGFIWQMQSPITESRVPTIQRVV